MKKIVLFTFLLCGCAKSPRNDLSLPLNPKDSVVFVNERLVRIHDSILILEKERTNIIKAYDSHLIEAATFHLQVKKVGSDIRDFIQEYVSCYKSRIRLANQPQKYLIAK